MAGRQSPTGADEEDDIITTELDTSIEENESQELSPPRTPPVRIINTFKPPPTPPRKHGRKRRNIGWDDDDDDVIVPTGFGERGKKCEECQRQGKRKFGTLANNWRDGWFQPLRNFPNSGNHRCCQQHMHGITNNNEPDSPYRSIRRNLFPSNDDF
uniref:Uncharacterized protein n=1 Tax=Aureoumbra lagunensis TaxID=44058 RepID=A0A7S3NL12_9STRA|mmetsp:Transcript_8774/g.12203  ORF Transcript_8774/g.12203 Transcript_8774/m.12203 type:complete len:156 (-) Transcript_8774:332-799(-)